MWKIPAGMRGECCPPCWRGSEGARHHLQARSSYSGKLRTWAAGTGTPPCKLNVTRGATSPGSYISYCENFHVQLYWSWTRSYQSNMRSICYKINFTEIKCLFTQIRVLLVLDMKLTQNLEECILGDFLLDVLNQFLKNVKCWTLFFIRFYYG